jgi:hypothetical protein
VFGGSSCGTSLGKGLVCFEMFGGMYKGVVVLARKISVGFDERFRERIENRNTAYLKFKEWWRL